jgi:hypothetical protein
MLKILKFVFIFLFSSHICIASRSLPEIECEMNDIIKGHLRHLKENSKRLNQDLTELEQLETLADDHVFHSGILTQMKGLDKTTLMQMCYLIKTDFEGMLATHEDLNKNFYPNMVSEISFNLENQPEFMRKYRRISDFIVENIETNFHNSQTEYLQYYFLKMLNSSLSDLKKVGYIFHTEISVLELTTLERLFELYTEYLCSKLTPKISKKTAKGRKTAERKAKKNTSLINQL